ncbi:hypothetical protein EV278_107181 [Caulobacter sp. BK020]|nr:hypothetical protein EV278_107181 [Caulobacter sp. BK020]
MAGAYAKMEAHEDLCAERYGNIHAAITELKADSKQGRNALYGLVVALLGWLMLQVYSDLKSAARPPPAPAAMVAVSPPAAPPVAPPASR